ncbi:hypothetical protein [Pseudoalteromonas maricaloris]|uniref:hypothetical protein n=1 Tax=Pseudoalteromonas maricaloris TaxID=184924 RepID=UPI003C167AED
MKFRIEQELEPSSIKDRVPPEYKGLASASEGSFEGQCALITFPHNRKDVVKSRIVLKALSKLKNSEFNTLVAVGGCFSLEAVDCLKSEGAIMLSLSEFSWTDARVTKIKSG